MSHARETVSSPLRSTSLIARLTPARGLRIGITGHLATSFAAIALLAVVANIIADQGTRIIEITRVTATAPAPLVTEPRVAAPPVAKVASTGPSSALTAIAEIVERYAAAVIVRTRVPTQEHNAKLEDAGRELQDRHNALAEADLSGRPEFIAALRDYQETGRALVALGDERRAAIESYAARLSLIDRQLNESADRGWRIFGRVVARENVLQLRTEHEAMRQALANLRASDAIENVAALAQLTDAASAFEHTVTENERGLKRAEGVQWFETLSSEIRQIHSLQLAIANASQRLQDAESNFLQARDLVKTQSIAAEPPAPTAPSAERVFVGPLPDRFVGPPIDGMATEPATRVSRQETDQKQKLLVAVLTGGVVLVVLLISVGTVRSIVMPIRRLLKATSDLKDGKHEPVPRGGIRELDTLGQSFNVMAQELLAARRNAQDQQLALEVRVADRTRQLQELAERDPLTDLPNRRHLLVLLEHALAHRNGKPVGVFFLDLDNFKNVNDSMGHGFGDELLKAVAQRLRETIADNGFAARLGGDEFTVVITGATSTDEVRQAGAAIIAAFQGTLPVDNRGLLTSISVGASICPDHDVTAEGLLKAADAALFRAKALGRSQLCLFTPELLSEAAAKFTTEQGLRRALERDEFALVFQPEFSAETLQPELVEALVRWRLPDGNMCSPNHFLAVAEESGLISEIGDWVLRAAIQAASRWHHGEWPSARVAINVSARQLLDRDFVRKVQSLLREYALPARCIEIELTETALQTGPATLETLDQLHEAGIATALDDFGTGYSSLASLERLPFSRVKLDKSLIGSIATNTRAASIARAIIWLCHRLGLDVTAEGVETSEQLAVLRAYRPMLVQGYLLAQPLPLERVVAELASVTAKAPALLNTVDQISVERLLDTVFEGATGDDLEAHGRAHVKRFAARPRHRGSMAPVRRREDYL